MNLRNKKGASPGIAIIEMVLVMIASLAIIAILYFVFQQALIEGLANRKNRETVDITPTGTTSNINKITDQDISVDTSEDTSIDDQIKQEVSNTNDTVEDLGGAYNASDL